MEALDMSQTLPERIEFLVLRVLLFYWRIARCRQSSALSGKASGRLARDESLPRDWSK